MISDDDRIKDIFEKIKWLDNNRWDSEVNNDELMNVSSDDLNNAEKVLTHFLCYISDRGMPFSQIWKKGAFVYSDIVHAYTEGKNTESIFKPDLSLNIEDPNSINNSLSFVREYILKKGKKDGGTNEHKKYEFISKCRVPKNNLLIKNKDYKENDYVTFLPRYYPSDYKAIMQTLMILEEFDKNIIKFISHIIDTKLKDEHLIKRIAYAFYLLAYYNIGQHKGIDYDLISTRVQDNKEFVMELLYNDSKFEVEFQKFAKSNRIFTLKRVWCALRDYIKFDEFRNYITEGFKDIRADECIAIWLSLDKSKLELPGDVWNNNSKFRSCLFSDVNYVTKEELDSANFNSSFFMRQLYDHFKTSIDEAYPEMFDVTFDFIPRMCENGMCDFCIFSENNKIADLCIMDSSKYCPLLMISCGYINKCSPDECVILRDNWK